MFSSIFGSHLRRISSSSTDWRVVHHVDLVVLNRWDAGALAAVLHHAHPSLASNVTTRCIFHWVGTSNDIMVWASAWAMNDPLAFQWNRRSSPYERLWHVSTSIDVILILSKPEQSRFAIIDWGFLWNDVKVDLPSCWPHLIIVTQRLTAPVSVTISYRN